MKVDASTYRSSIHSLIHNAVDIRRHARSLCYQDVSESTPREPEKKTSKRRFPRGGGAFGRLKQGCFSATQYISVRSKHRPPKWRRSDIRLPGEKIPVLSGCRLSLAQPCPSQDPKPRAPRPPKAVRTGTCARQPRTPPSVPPLELRPQACVCAP